LPRVISKSAVASNHPALDVANLLAALSADSAATWQAFFVRCSKSGEIQHGPCRMTGFADDRCFQKEG
jgi:hypothetical protein